MTTLQEARLPSGAREPGGDGAGAAAGPSDVPNGEAWPHTPVLLDPILRLFDIPAPKLLLDGTLGAGGHAAALLERHPSLRLIGIDRDPAALAIARQRLAPFGERVCIVEARASEFPAVLAEAHADAADLMLFDLGISSMQLTDSERGFSFVHDGPLDMRMGGEGETASELIDRLGEAELADVIYQYGEERLSRRIARAIKSAHDDGVLKTTADLRAVCRAAYPKGRHRIDPATRTFQALRIAVNDELGELERVLAAIPRHLTPGGRAAVISFHSLEDRLVKRAFLAWKAESWAEILTKKPLQADSEELRANPRARSAKLRAIARKHASGDRS